MSEKNASIASRPSPVFSWIRLKSCSMFPPAPGGPPRSVESSAALPDCRDDSIPLESSARYLPWSLYSLLRDRTVRSRLPGWISMRPQ